MSDDYGVAGSVRERVEAAQERLAKERGSLTPEEEVQLLGTVAYGLVELADAEEGDPSLLDRAVEVFREAAAVFEREGDARGLASSRASVAVVLSRQGRHRESNEEFVEAIRLLERGGADAALPELLECVKGVGLNLLKLGDFDGAKAQFEEGASVARASGDLANLIDCLVNLIHVAESSGMWADSVPLWEELASVFEEAGDAAGLVASYASLATTYLRLHGTSPKEHPRALELASSLLDGALALAEEIGDPRLLAKVHERLAEAATAKRDLKAASQSLEAARRAYTAAGATGDADRVATLAKFLSRHAELAGKRGGGHGGRPERANRDKSPRSGQ
ncbi:MAG: hypothetical protein Kow0069_08330 [Promethearchaeota archaeon]